MTNRQLQLKVRKQHYLMRCMLQAIRTLQFSDTPKADADQWYVHFKKKLKR